MSLVNPPSLPRLRGRSEGRSATRPRRPNGGGKRRAEGWRAHAGIVAFAAGVLCAAPLAGQGTQSQPAGGPAQSVYRKAGAAQTPPPTASTQPAFPQRPAAVGTAPGDPAPGGAAADSGGPYSRGRPSPGQAAALGDQSAQAERIVSATLSALGRAGSISARVRQRVRMGDRVLVGAGRYVQSGLGEDQRYRLEVTMKADTETFETLEVCDGLFAWSYRRIGAQQPQLERIDVRRVRDRIRQLQPADDVPVAPHLGGVQRTLALARTWFRFVHVETTAIDGLPVWRVEGRWHPESLATLLPAQAEAATGPGGIPPADLPDGMPWSVRISIGKRELFPYRIEWLAIPGRRPVADREPEPIAVLELYEVRLDEPVDAAAFVYKPATDGLIDLTDAHVQRLAPLRP